MIKNKENEVIKMILPLVSVILPTYSRTESLAAALDSLSKQDYPEFEVVVVDDNSDETLKREVRDIVEKFKEKHPKIKLDFIVNEKNCGSAMSRNIGINRARGEYITFLDDDDVYMKDKISVQLKGTLEANADYSITDLYLYNEKGHICDKRIRDYITDYNSENLLKWHMMYHITGTDSLMFRTSYIKKIGSFTLIDRGDEFYLMLKAIKGGGKFCYIKTCGVKALVHTKTKGLSSGQGKIDGENQLFEFKKTYFSQFDKKTVKYIKMRHEAVIAFAYLRMKKHTKFIVYSARSFFSAPFSCVELFLKFLR